jgi:hypothetical protein
MPGATVAIAVSDPALRLLVAQAFDDAPQAWRVSFSDLPRPDADVVVVDDAARGDGVVFDPACPDRLLGEIRARLDHPLHSLPCRTVAVTGVAGTGVTSIALHLASIWGRRSETSFVDLDRSWSCVGRLGLGPEVATWDAADRTSDPSRPPWVPLAPGVRALVAPAGASPVRSDTVVKEARKASGRLVLDVPYGYWEPEIAALVDAAVVVMSPCVPHAHRVAGILQSVTVDRVAVVSNRLGRGGETTRREIESLIGRKIAVELPTFPGLRDAEGRQGLARLAWSRWGRTLARLARALEAS